MTCILQKSTLFYIQQLLQAPYQDKCRNPSGSQCCFPRSQKPFPGRIVLQISKLSKKGQKLSTIITTSKLQVVLKLSSQFNLSFFGVDYAAHRGSCKGKGWKMKGFIKIGRCSGFFLNALSPGKEKRAMPHKQQQKRMCQRVNHFHWSKLALALGAYKCTGI